jgi:hypothetical protein
MTELERDILNIPGKFPVDDIRVGDYAVWPIIRNELALYLTATRYVLPEVVADAGPKPATVMKRIIRDSKLRKSLNHFLFNYHVSALRQTDILFISWPGEPYPDKKNERSYSRYIDPYYETAAAAKFKCSKINTIEERTSSETYFIPTDVLSLKYYRVAKKQSSREITGYNEFVKFANDPVSGIKGITDSIAFFSRVQGVILESIFLIEFYVRVLEKIRPKAVVFEEYYNKYNYALCCAAKKLGIPSIEIQHGTLFLFHQYWDNAGTAGENFFPDFVGVWSGRDKNFLETNRIRSCKPKVIGNLYIHQENAGNTSEEFHTLFPGATGKLKVLVSLQYNISRLPQIFYTLLRQSGQQDISWFFRFHPQTSEGLRNQLQSELDEFPHAEYKISTKTSLYSLLPAIDIHLTESSTVCMEALQFGKPTIFVSDDAFMYFKDLIDKGVFHFSKDANEILEMIKNGNSYHMNDTPDLSFADNKLFEAFLNEL